jgi:hypothetical protein
VASEWYYMRDGERHGPVAAGVLRELAARGQLRRTDQVWSEGQTAWVPAANLRGLFPNRSSRDKSPVVPATPHAAKPPVSVPTSGAAQTPNPFAFSTAGTGAPPAAPQRRYAGPRDRISRFTKIAFGIVGASVLFCCIPAMVFESIHNPGANSYGSTGEILKAFDAVYTMKRQIPGQQGYGILPSGAVVAIKGRGAVIYVQHPQLGLRWYKWSTETQAKIDASPIYAKGGNNTVEYSFDGSVVSFSVKGTFSFPGAMNERESFEWRGDYRLDEADRVKK